MGPKFERGRGSGTPRGPWRGPDQIGRTFWRGHARGSAHESARGSAFAPSPGSARGSTFPPSPGSARGSTFTPSPGSAREFRGGPSGQRRWRGRGYWRGGTRGRHFYSRGNYIISYYNDFPTRVVVPETFIKELSVWIKFVMTLGVKPFSHQQKRNVGNKSLMAVLSWFMSDKFSPIKLSFGPAKSNLIELLLSLSLFICFIS